MSGVGTDDEILDVFDEGGRHLGTKRRADVHRDGDWHLAFHLWVVAPAGVLLQRRARGKSSWPGFLDASAAGHLLAGETIRDGLREVDEEARRRLRVRRSGAFRGASSGRDGALRDREP